MKNYALRITLIYFVLGILWILLSDSVVDFLIADRPQLLFIQRIKGIFYVAVTAWLIYFLIRKFYDGEQRIRNEYRNTFRDFPHPMWIYDPKSLRILAVNQMALQKYGYSEHEFLNMSITDLRPEAEIQKLEKHLDHINETAQNSGLWKHRKKNGDSFYVEVYGNQTSFRRRPARLVLAIDVNEMVLARNRIVDQNTRLQRIAQLQAHEIRGPVASILGLISIFDRSNKKPEENLEVMNNLETAAVQLDTVVQEIVGTTQEPETDLSTDDDHLFSGNTQQPKN